VITEYGIRWDKETGDPDTWGSLPAVRVALLDLGVDLAHPEEYPQSFDVLRRTVTYSEWTTVDWEEVNPA
jgi:hypothetical protein